MGRQTEGERLDALSHILHSHTLHVLQQQLLLHLTPLLLPNRSLTDGNVSNSCSYGTWLCRRRCQYPFSADAIPRLALRQRRRTRVVRQVRRELYGIGAVRTYVHGQAALREHKGGDGESDAALGARQGGVAVVHVCGAGQLQRGAGGPVDEQQAGPWVGGQIA